MTRFTTVDQAILEKTKVSKILPRFVKKGGDVTRKLAQQILDNVAVATKRKSEEKKDSKPTKPTSTVSATSTARNGKVATVKSVQMARQPPQPAGSKRERDPEEEILPTTKRSAQSFAKRLNLPSTSQRGGKPYTGTAGKTAAITPPAPKSGTSATVQKPVAPTSIFSSLMSASKKPGTSNAARAAAAAAAKDKGEEKKPTATSKPPAFSFSETMADLTKPKEAAPAKRDIKPKTNETEEERAARLKKEKKRQLKVRFKSDEELVEVRLFTHDPDEEIRADPSMVKDVTDVGGEGRMLKLHLGDDDLDDEDEVIEMKEEDFGPWPTLVAIDFSIFSDKQRSTSFIKFGGTQLPDSAEKLAQEKREANSLPPLRTSLADIPESPKEPPPLEEEEAKKEQPEPAAFGEPGELVKARSDKVFESRVVQTSINSPPTAPAAVAAQPTNNLSSLLGLLQGGQQGNNSATHSNPLADLEKTFSQFRAPAAIPTAPAAMQPQPQPQPSAFNGLDITKLLAVISASQQMGTAAPILPMQQAAVPTPNTAALLSQISNITGLNQIQPQNTGFGHNPAANSGQVYEHEDRKRLREEGFSYDNQTKRAKNGPEGKKKQRRRFH